MGISGFKNPIMISFAGPRAGNPKFAHTFNFFVRNSIRVVNTFDLLPDLPPSVIHLHVRRPYAFSLNAGDTSENHALATYIKGLERLRKTQYVRL